MSNAVGYFAIEAAHSELGAANSASQAGFCTVAARGPPANARTHSE